MAVDKVAGDILNGALLSAGMRSGSPHRQRAAFAALEVAPVVVPNMRGMARRSRRLRQTKQRSLVADARGNLYGVTEFGGASNRGTVFRLSPPAIAGQPWPLTTLVSFTEAATSPSLPDAALVLDSRGNLFGVSDSGGTSANGTVFQVSPPVGGGTPWIVTVLHSFNGTDGSSARGRLLPMRGGSFYGTTYIGGAFNNHGTVFHIVPPAGGIGPWTFTSLHSFLCKNGEGTNPDSGFSLISSGKLIGTASVCGNNGTGTVYMMQP